MESSLNLNFAEKRRSVQAVKEKFCDVVPELEGRKAEFNACRTFP